MRSRWWVLSSIFLAAMLSFGCSDDTAGLPDGGPPDDGAIIADGAQLDTVLLDTVLLDDGGRPICEPGEQRFHPGCEPGTGYMTITEGCYNSCSAADDTSCPADTACREAWVNPCVCDPTPGLSCCAACGSSQWLCLSKTLPYPLANIDEPCDGKLTAKEVLEGLRSPYTATFIYANDAQSALTLTLIHEGGSILCHPEQLAPPGTAMPDRPARVELEIAVTLKTDDGFFDERFTTALEGQVGWGSFSHEMEISALVGTFTPTNDHTKITFQATFNTSSAQGTISTRGDSGVGPNLGSWATP